MSAENYGLYASAFNFRNASRPRAQQQQHNKVQIHVNPKPNTAPSNTHVVPIGRETEFGNAFDVAHNPAPAAVKGFSGWVHGKGASVQEIATKYRLTLVSRWQNASLPEHTQLVNGVLNIYQAGLATGSVTLSCPAHQCQKNPAGCHGQVLARVLKHMFSQAEKLQPPPALPPYAPPPSQTPQTRKRRLTSSPHPKQPHSTKQSTYLPTSPSTFLGPPAVRWRPSPRSSASSASSTRSSPPPSPR